MDPKNLKNYGKSLLEMMATVPQNIQEDNAAISFKIIEKYLGLENMDRFLALVAAEKEKMIKKDLSKISKIEEFIFQQIDWAALFSAITQITEKDKAIEILSDVAEQTYPKVFSFVFPDPENIKALNEPFAAFKEWFLALMSASKDIGIFDFETVENENNVFQVNCTWCAWHEIYKELGTADACIPVCCVDDIFYPEYCRKAGINYTREKSLGKGGDFCDYRFERQG